MKNRQEEEGRECLCLLDDPHRADRDSNPGLSQVGRGDCESLHPRCPIPAKTLLDSLILLRDVRPRRLKLHFSVMARCRSRGAPSMSSKMALSPDHPAGAGTSSRTRTSRTTPGDALRPGAVQHSALYKQRQDWPPPCETPRTFPDGRGGQRAPTARGVGRTEGPRSSAHSPAWRLRRCSTAVLPRPTRNRSAAPCAPVPGAERSGAPGGA